MKDQKTVLVIGASTSINSINRRFAQFAASQLKSTNMVVLDLNDFEMPIFSVDREKEGYPEASHRLRDLIEHCDGIILSLAEHNGSYTAAFKNILDWTSRLDRNLWKGKPMLLLSTSNGARGAKTVMEAALNYFPRLNANIISHFSLPSFRDNFDGQEILNDTLSKGFLASIEAFQNQLN